MLRKLGTIVGLLAFATLLAQALGIGYLALQGRLTGHQLAQLAAVLHGVDLLARTPAEPTPSPAEMISVDEVLEARAIRSRQLELRAQNIEDRATEARRLQHKLEEDMQLYRQARRHFEQQLEEWETGEKAQALAATVALLGQMKPKQAQEQLMQMLKNGEMDAVITLLKGMPVDKQSKIAAEFKEPEEVRLLAEVLRRLREGEPEISLAEETRRRLQADNEQDAGGL